MRKHVIHFVLRREDEVKKKKRTGCGATNACVSLKKESGVIRSDIVSRYARTSSPPAFLLLKFLPFLNGFLLLQKAPSFSLVK